VCKLRLGQESKDGFENVCLETGHQPTGCYRFQGLISCCILPARIYGGNEMVV
jgi:hypothetical protein